MLFDQMGNDLRREKLQGHLELGSVNVLTASRAASVVECSTNRGGDEMWGDDIGIGHPGHASKVSGYVLSRPSQVDRGRIADSIDEAMRALPLLLDGDAGKAMTQLHSFRAA